MGDKKLNYFGFSYGTFLGATYSSLFPDNYRAMVLDGPLDANAYINKPEAGCASSRPASSAGSAASSRPAPVQGHSARSAEPIRWRPSTRSSTQAIVLAIPVPASTADPRPLNGDDCRGDRHRDVQQGSGRCSRRRSRRRARATARSSASSPTPFWGNNDDGTFDPGSDRYFTITAIEQNSRATSRHYLDAGDNAWGIFDHSAGTRATSSSTMRSGRSTPRTRSTARSRPPSRRPRSSRSRRRMTRQRRSAAPSAWPRSSATSAS